MVMFPVYPLAPEEQPQLSNQTIYREDYQGKPSYFENPRHQNLRTSARINCNPLMPFLMTKFPSDFRYVPEHEGIVKQLREAYLDVNKNSLCTTYSQDFGSDPSGIKYMAEAYPVLSGKDIYKPSCHLGSVTSVSYRGEQIPSDLKTKRRPSTCARQGLMPIMYPHGNMSMETKTEYQAQYMAEKCSKCLGKNIKHCKTKGIPAKEPKLTEDYIPLAMQPIN